MPPALFLSEFENGLDEAMGLMQMPYMTPLACLRVFLLTTALVLATAEARPQELEWVQAAGGPGYDEVLDIRLDPAGNAYVLYHGGSSMAIDGRSFSSGASETFVLAKHRSTGALVWSGMFRASLAFEQTGGWVPGSGVISGVRLETGSDGAVYLAGQVAGTAQWHGPDAGANGVSALLEVPALNRWGEHDFDIFLLKLDGDGKLLWQRIFGGNEKEECSALSVKGEVIAITGTYGLWGGNFGGVPLVASSGWGNRFVAVLEAKEGVPRWVKTVESQGFGVQPSVPAPVQAAADGSVYFGPPFLENLLVGNLEFKASPAGAINAALVRYSSSGELLWAKHIVGDDVHSMALDPAGNIYISGFYGAVTPVGRIDTTEVRGSREYLAKFDPKGSVLWAKPDGGRKLVFGLDGLYGAGAFLHQRMIGSQLFRATGDTDAFAARWDENGDVQWARTFSDRASEYAWAVAVDSAGTVWIGGGTENGLQQPSNFGLPFYGSLDAFLARFVVTGPQLTLHPLSQVVVRGADVVMEISVARREGATFEWLKNGQPLGDNERVSGTHSERLEIRTVEPADEGEYSARVRDASGEALSGTGRLRIEGLMRFVSVEQLENGPLRLTFQGSLHRVYEIETSTDLRTWALLTNGIARADGQLVVHDPKARSGERTLRAYRAVAR